MSIAYNAAVAIFGISTWLIAHTGNPGRRAGRIHLDGWKYLRLVRRQSVCADPQTTLWLVRLRCRKILWRVNLQVCRALDPLPAVRDTARLRDSLRRLRGRDGQGKGAISQRRRRLIYSHSSLARQRNDGARGATNDVARGEESFAIVCDRKA